MKNLIKKKFNFYNGLILYVNNNNNKNKKLFDLGYRVGLELIFNLFISLNWSIPLFD